jgi:hypothetical protein
MAELPMATPAVPADTFLKKSLLFGLICVYVFSGAKIQAAK